MKTGVRQRVNTLLCLRLSGQVDLPHLKNAFRARREMELKRGVFFERPAEIFAVSACNHVLRRGLEMFPRILQQPDLRISIYRIFAQLWIGIHNLDSRIAVAVANFDKIEQ